MKKFSKISRFVILFGLLIFFLYLAFRDINFSGLLTELGRTNYFLAILAMLIGVYVGSWIRAYRWKYFLYPEKKELKLTDLFSAVMVGYFFNALIPRAGELSRPFLLAQKYGISKAFTLGTIVVERIFDMLSMFLVFGLCLMFYRDDLQKAFGEYNIEGISLYFSIGMILFVVIVSIMLLKFDKTEKLIEKINNKILPEKYQAKVNRVLLSLISGFSFLKYPKYYYKIFLFTVLLWLDYALSTWVLMFAFKNDILNSLSYMDANLVLTLTSFAQTLPLPGNSAGSIHFFIKTTLNVVFGVDNETALAFGTVNHMLGFLGIITIGLYYSVKENYKFSFKSSREETPEIQSISEKVEEKAH